MSKYDIGVLPVIFAALTCLFTLQCVKIVRIALDADLRKIPGPVLARYTHLHLKWKTITGRRMAYIHSLHQQYGAIVRTAPEEVSVADIEAFREIHKIGTRYRKGQWYHKHPIQNTDDRSGVVTIRDLRKASARRKLYQQAITKGAVMEWEPMMVSYVNKAVQKIRREATAGTADIVKCWTMMTADILGTLAFGEAFHVIDKDEKPQLLKDLDDYMMAAGLHAELPWIWAIIGHIPWPRTGPLISIFERTAAYSEVAVRNTKKSLQGCVKTIFSKLVQDDGDEAILDDIIRQESWNVIVAGSDTTAVTLTYLVYRVLKDPEIKQKLLDELASCSPEPGLEELEGLPYLNRVVQETLRLHAAAPSSLPRTAPGEGAVMAGYKIPADTTVYTQAYTFHREPSVWKDPERFDPDRWIDPTPEMKLYFMPFGGAARSCVGQSIARLELLHAVSAFFRACPNARIAEGTTEESMEMRDYFVIRPAHGECDITMA